MIPRLALMLVLLLAAGHPAIVDAVRKGDREALRSLIQKGTNVNEAEADGATALHWAAYRDDLQAADALLKAGAKVNAANDLGTTALWNASQNGSEAMVKRLLDAGADPNLLQRNVANPLWMASSRRSRRHLEVLKILIGAGARIDTLSRSTDGIPTGTTLMRAATAGNLEAVRELLAAGADPNVSVVFGTALTQASAEGHYEVVKALLDA